jgi:hypothetical protein
MEADGAPLSSFWGSGRRGAFAPLRLQVFSRCLSSPSSSLVDFGCITVAALCFLHYCDVGNDRAGGAI